MENLNNIIYIQINRHLFVNKSLRIQKNKISSSLRQGHIELWISRHCFNHFNSFYIHSMFSIIECRFRLLEKGHFQSVFISSSFDQKSQRARVDSAELSRHSMVTSIACSERLQYSLLLIKCIAVAPGRSTFYQNTEMYSRLQATQIAFQIHSISV